MFKKNIYIKSIDDLKNHYYNTPSDESNVVLKTISNIVSFVALGSLTSVNNAGNFDSAKNI